MQGTNYLNRKIVVKHVLGYVRKIHHLLIYQNEEMNRVLESTSNASPWSGTHVETPLRAP